MPPMNLLVKPASGSCNMRCKYCFYADEAQNRETASMGHMSLDTMKAMVDKALDYSEGNCTIAFQGGEPTLRGLDFFQALSDYVASRPGGHKVRYAFQTNGIHLTEDWAAWFAKNRVLVGVSLDGPKDIHDRYRLDAQGKGTYNRVTANLRLLEKHKVDYNILTVVSAANARRARQLYDYFKKNGYGYQQYIECLDPLGETPGKREFSLTPERYETFLKTLFDAWYLDARAGKYVYNRYFENLLMILAGQGAESCNMRGVCGVQWVIEADGSVYPCDFYALDEWRLGNINADSIEAMEEKRRELGFIEASCAVPEECRGCKWYPLCRNGCRRNRQENGQNYFCPAYKGFFDYAFPRLQEVYRLRMGRR